MKLQPLISIVVVCRDVSDFFIRKTYPAIIGQTYRNWELLLLPDKPSAINYPRLSCIPTWPKTGPADKKDIGINNSNGDLIAFIDDDAYPDTNWLKNSVNYFTDNTIAAVCGPGLTPPDDCFSNQISGWFWASPLGSGGAGTYRCWPAKVREVDDYPTFNLLIKKNDLQKIGGFDSQYWPGEDTKLCHDLVYKLNKKIIYDPTILVYHQRRPILKAHLKQLGRYGLHRGHFVRILPKTSRRLGYFGPAFFASGVIGGVITGIFSLIYPSTISFILFKVYLFSLGVYFIFNVINSLWVFLKCKSMLAVVLLIPTTFISHIFYGLMFIKGLAGNKLTSKYGREKL